MRAREYNLLEECVERGLRSGWHKAHKHTDRPTPEQIWETQAGYVMSEVSAWFIFDEVRDES